MKSLNLLPSIKITSHGIISQKFIELDIFDFKEACFYIHNLPYGYNSDKDNPLILFIENMGSCTTKHGVIATLAEELSISLHKHVGIYRFTEDIVEGANIILEKYNISFIPMVHCFLVYKNEFFDLTEGNHNGKKKGIDFFLHEERTIPFITRNDEYRLYRKILDEKILKMPEMNGISRTTVLKAREEAILLLKKKIE